MKREFLVQNPRPDGYHLMMELYGCDSGKINSRRYLHNLVKCAVKKARLTNLGSRFHQFQPHGVTGYHTFPSIPGRNSVT